MSLRSAVAEGLPPVTILATPRQYLVESVAQDLLYAILDACDDPEIQAMVQTKQFGGLSLYNGKAASTFALLAPYLCKIDTENLSWIERELKGRPWGYFVIVNPGTQLAQLRKHFRRFLLVTGPDGRELYFRFYDPRVITTFLRALNPREASDFFGPIQEFVVPDIDQFLTIRLDSNRA
jgi:hypothetical protein